MIEVPARSPRVGKEFPSEDFVYDGDDVERFRTGLYQNHLPHLHEAGVVVWDADTDVVTPRSRFDEIGQLLQLINPPVDELPRAAESETRSIPNGVADK